MLDEEATCRLSHCGHNFETSYHFTNCYYSHMTYALNQVSMMERDFYLGRILTGRVSSGIVRAGDKVHGIRSTESGVQKIEEGKVCLLFPERTFQTYGLRDCAGDRHVFTIDSLVVPWKEN